MVVILGKHYSAGENISHLLIPYGSSRGHKIDETKPSQTGTRSVKKGARKADSQRKRIRKWTAEDTVARKGHIGSKQM